MIEEKGGKGTGIMMSRGARIKAERNRGTRIKAGRNRGTRLSRMEQARIKVGRNTGLGLKQDGTGG